MTKTCKVHHLSLSNYYVVLDLTGPIASPLTDLSGAHDHSESASFNGAPYRSCQFYKYN